jgi:hypothetical protein
MPPKKRVKRSSDANTAREDAEPQRRSSRPTRGVGGHVAQLKKSRRNGNGPNEASECVE